MAENSGSSILKAGDYRLDRLTIRSMVSNTSADIRYLISYIEIFEDMFSPCITAKIYMNENLNLPEYLPIRGQETVELTFKTDVNSADPVKLLFRVYKLDSHQIDKNNKSQTYTLHLISEGGYYNFTEQCGYAVQGSVSEMVVAVFRRHFPDSVWKDRLDIEDTKDNYQFVLPQSHNPFKAIHWLSSKAISNTGNEYSPFLFFETVAGYRFRSLSSLMENSPKDAPKYYFNTGNIALENNTPSASPSGSSPANLPARYYKVQTMEEMSRFDMVTNFKESTVSSTVIVHDLVNKQTRKIDFREGEIFGDMRKLGSVQHFSNADPSAEKLYRKSATIEFMPVTPFTVYTEVNNIVDNMKTESIYLKKKFHMNSLLNGQRVMIQVFGDSERKLGDVIELYVPKISADARSHEDQRDKNLSGQYMITSIKHTLSTAYSCKFELTKSFLGV